MPADIDPPDGHLPEIYQRFERQYPQVLDAFKELTEREHAAGPLSERDRRLVKLGMAIGMASRGGVKSAVRHAVQSGISPDDVRHAVVLSISTIGFPAAVASFRWVEEAL